MLNKISRQNKEIQLVSDMELRAQEARVALARLRRQLEDYQQTKGVRHCQKAIRDALVFLALHSPLNKKTKGGDLLCPLTGRAIYPGRSIAFSNGCQYDREALGYCAKGRSHYPRRLPGSTLEIDRHDVKLAQNLARIDFVALGLRGGVVAAGVL